MIEIELAEPAGRTPVSLELRTTKGSGVFAPDRLDDRLILGEPAVGRLAPETAVGDDELRAFLTDEAAHTAYWLVQFTCTFEHDDELPFTKAWLQLGLSSDEGKAVAHSMEPTKLATNRTVSWTAKLTIPCILVDVGVMGEHDIEDVFCEAGAEGTAQPAWKYYATSSTAIRGLQRMRLVVRTPIDGGLSATARIGATVTHERFGRKPLSYDMVPEPARRWLDALPPHAARAGTR